MTKTEICIISLLLLPLWGISQEEKQLFSVQELQEDFNFWRDQLEAKSPLLYYYNSRAESDQYFDSIYSLINRPMTDAEFYQLISPATSFLKDVHSGIQPSDAMSQRMINHPTIIPIDLCWIENKAYVAVTDSAKNIAVGAEVIKINDIDIQEIYQDCSQRMPNDGFSKAYSQYLINSNFWLVFHACFGYRNTYKIEYLNGLGHLKTVSIDGANWQTLMKLRENTKRPLFKDDLPLIALSFIDSLNAANLKIRSFDNQLFKHSNQEKFDKTIKSIFKNIKSSGVSNLIIDIRNNEGGDPVNSALVLQYLLFEQFQISNELRTVKNPGAEEFFKRTKMRWLPFYGLGKFKPEKNNHFDGNLYVLINGGTCSAASEFAGTIQKHERGQFIGSETGGNPIFLSGSIFSNLHLLPNTQLRGYVGTLGSINDSLEKNTGYGLLPDHPVQWRPEDFINRNDPVEAFACALIERWNTQKNCLDDLKDSINSQYGLYEGAPSINSGPCGNFANLFYHSWNNRFEKKVTISFIFSADSSECYHVLIKLPNGDYYDGGNGVLTRQQLVNGYEKGMYIIDMLDYNYHQLDQLAYGLERNYPRCPNYSKEKTTLIIDFYLNQLKQKLESDI
jgi:hypothetical protein